MFDIVATNTVTITCLDVNFNGFGTEVFELYYKSGGFAGFSTNSAAWTLIGSVAVTGQGVNNVTPIPMLLNIVIPAGETYGFYVTNTNASANPGIRYTNSSGTNLVLGSDANMTIRGGIGKTYPFAADFNNRSFNGTIHYQLGNSPLGSLPVELADFDLVMADRQVELSWATLSELNNAFFTVERSADGQAWEVLERVQGAGVTTEPQFYSATDAAPFPDRSYYRLSQTDTDGQTHTLSTKMVATSPAQSRDVRIFPNPAHEQLTVQTAAGAMVRLLDPLGHLIYQQVMPAGYDVMLIETAALAAGLYQVEVIGSNGVRTLSRIAHE